LHWNIIFMPVLFPFDEDEEGEGKGEAVCIVYVE
jgi:hypothetical protein